MNALRLTALLIYTFGAFAYGAILVLWLRELWQRRGTADPAGRESELVNGTLVMVSFAWFVLNTLSLLPEFGARRPGHVIEATVIFLAFFYPPLIMHTAWVERGPALPAGHSVVWRLVLWPAYAVSLAIPAWCFLTFADPESGEGLKRLANQLLNVALYISFIAAAMYSAGLTRMTPAARAPERRQRNSLIALYAVMSLVFLTLLVLTSGDAGIDQLALTAVGIAARSLPLLFLFVVAYYENRFQFFDLFVKRGLALMLTIAVLTIWFALALPLLNPLAGAWAAPWIFAIALLPVVAVMPLLYRALTRFLDRRWLGRRFTTVEAVTCFLAGLRAATSESELVERAQQGLSDIFYAPAAVQLGARRPVEFEIQHETAVPVAQDGGDPVRLHFVLGRRTSDAPYFSQDAELLRTLADVFASSLDNVRLQQRRQAQDQLARELSLHASRSELKALRAQINPHFLFNALNAIAGLIHRDPAVADRTIERLAEVFRYALRGAESEWAALEDELEFVRAYLEVERARFGDRLEVAFEVAPEARAARVPTMMLQTLVENAVKHGVSTVRGRGFVGINAHVLDSRLVLTVADNGPGFESADTPGTRRNTGYGLANIRERLNGYFGDAAALSIARDHDRQKTAVTMTLPLVRERAPQAAGGSR